MNQSVLQWQPASRSPINGVGGAGGACGAATVIVPLVPVPFLSPTGEINVSEKMLLCFNRAHPPSRPAVRSARRVRTQGPLALISVLASARGHWHEKGGGGVIKRPSGSKAVRMQLKEQVTDRG